MVVVCTIVSDIQLTVSIYQRQVTITVQTTYTTPTDRDEVTVIDIMDRCRSITEYRISIGKHFGRTRRGITTGKYGIVDNDAFLVGICLTQLSPLSSTGSLVTQVIKIGCRHKGTYRKGRVTDGDSSVSLTPRLYENLTVLSEVIATIIVVTFFITIISFSIILGTCCTIYATDITGTEDVTITLGNTIGSTYLTTIDIHLGLTEDIASCLEVQCWYECCIHVFRTVTAPAVLTATATEDVTKYMTII